MAGKTHQHLVLAFDKVVDSISAEREGHYLEVMLAIEDAKEELGKALEIATTVQEKLELKVKKNA